MSGITISTSPPTDWSTICTADNLLFHSPDWLRLLESSFDAQSQYIWDADARRGGAVSSFPAGPFRLGYLGFPFGGVVGDSGISDELLQSWRIHRAELQPMAIRVPVSAFGGCADLDLSFESTPETAIVDLPSWTLEVTSGNHRRDIKKAMRSELEVSDAGGAADGGDIFRIYSDTVKRQRGALRYNETYFVKLIELAQSSPLIRVLVARAANTIAGFTVVVRHGPAGFYLHGGTHLEHRQHQPSAVLLYEAIQWAQSLGCGSFNLMSSPADQESLIWYKEKWGGETREHRTYTLALRSSFRLFRVAERIYRLVR
jgi:hypothetical protein